MSDLGLRAAVRLALPPLVAGKAVALLVGWLTVWMTSPHPGLPSWERLTSAFASWDGESYRTLAESGYPGGPLDTSSGAPGHLWGFFPGLPLTVHVLRWLLVDTVLTAVVVNAVCELLALAYLVRLVRLERGGGEAQAQDAAWLLALWPYAVFLTVFYTEAPFLAAATASLYHMRRGARGDHARACTAAMLATATRVTGLALVVPLLMERAAHRRRLADWQLLLTGLAVLPLPLFMAYARWRTGDALAWFHIETSESYGSRHLDWPWNGLHLTWDSALSLPANRYGFIFALEAVFGVAGVLVVMLQAVATVWPLPRIAPSMVVYSLGVLLPPICLTYWISVPRYLMSMVPVYILAADALRGRERLRLPVLALMSALAALGTGILTSGSFLA